MSLNFEILVAMSGGVDSGVSALVAKEACGNRAVGATMKLFDEELLGRPITSTCCSIDDVDDAKEVCHKIGIPHYTLNCKEAFTRHVVDPFVASYIAGKTPNPCIACNRHLKFDELFRKAKTLGCDTIATGHYARIEKEAGKLVLKRGLDVKKDQSYVLHTLTKEQLKHVIFPIGALDKHTVRQIAADFDLVVAEKKESQDICFVEDGSVDKFISHYLKNNNVKRVQKQGTFLNKQGEKLGEFDGRLSFTIGQRKGLNLALGHPVYVTDIDKENNVVTIGEKEDLLKSLVFAGDFNWISITPKAGDKLKCTAKIRYNMKDVPAKATFIEEGQVEVEFEDGVSAPAKGQSVVLYDGEVVLGGGYIQESK